MAHILILGGGAAGLAAALAAAQAAPAVRVTVLERNPKVGKKLLATGNGRCNLDNTAIAPEKYFTADPAALRPLLAAVDAAAPLAWFEQLGLYTRTDEAGRVYPYSNQAADVLALLELHLQRHKVQLRTGCTVSTLRQSKGGYAVQFTTAEGGTENLRADAVICAMGGAAGPQFGTDGFGTRFAADCGGQMRPLYPCLTALQCVRPNKSLAGIRAKAAARLLDGDRVLAEEIGEVQFTDFGLSGPEAFTLSRAAATGGDGQELALDFFREYGDSVLLDMLQEKREKLPELAAEDLFAGMLQSRLGRMIVKRAGLKYQTKLKELTDEQLLACVKTGKWFTLEVTGVMGFDSAQVTAGGAKTREFDARTLESTKNPGLFVCGEVLDVDGDCGGFNLQWAWSSGYLAGKLGEGEYA